MTEQVTAIGDCLVWNGGTDSNGKPRLKVNGKHVRAARHYWEQANGEVPAGLVVVNTRCSDKRCVAPAHHELLSKRDAAGTRSRTGSPKPKFSHEPWKDKAACLDAPMAGFLPDASDTDTAKALALCMVCPVRSECAQWATRVNFTGGVAGGQRV